MKPTNGWYNGNYVNWDGMGEPEFPDYGTHCPHCGNELRRTLQKRCGACKTEIDWDNAPEYLSEKQYFGDWKRRGKIWSPDKSGNFAAIYDANDNSFAVVWSKTVRYGHHGGPCISGQVHAELEDAQEPPTDVEVIELVPGDVAPYGRWYVSPYYALPDDCLWRRNDE